MPCIYRKQYHCIGLTAGLTFSCVRSEKHDIQYHRIIQKFSAVGVYPVIIDNMMNLEALAIPDEAKICPVHRKPLKKKQINYKNFANKPTYGIVLRICNECHRVYIEESKMLTIDNALFVRGIPHRFYDLDITNKYLRSQMPPYEFSAEDTLYIPGTWVEEDPRCPIHEEELYEVPCFKKYKDREIRFTGFRCDRCDKILMRRSSARDLFDKCAEKGIPQIKTEKLVNKAIKKQLSAKEIRSDYIIQNGKKHEFRSNVSILVSFYRFVGT